MSTLIKGAFAMAMLAVATEAKKKEVCRALALSGGGNNGAWEAGVLYGFAHYGTVSDFEYDVVTGVSAGSINAMAISGWELGKEVEMTEWISDLWKNLHTSDVWVDWALGKASGFLIMGGVVDNSPLLNFMQHVMSQFDTFQKMVTLTSTEVNTGAYTEFDQTNTDFRDLPEAAFCSASIPFIFPQHVWKAKGGVFMDGGTVYNINIESAIRQCLTKVDDESQIIVDALFCGAPTSPPTESEDGNSWENFFRQRQLKSYYHDSNSIATTMYGHPDIQMRYVIKQQDGFTGLDEINFEGDFTWPGQTKGRQDAQDALNGNANMVNVRDLMSHWNSSSEVQAEYAHVADYIDAVHMAVKSESLSEQSPLN